MTTHAVLNGLLGYLCLVILLTFHEFAHAWVAWKCGDDTARAQGRVTLNPLAHMDLLGTVILPLLAVFLAAANSTLAGFIIGWGRPVPVDPRNLSRPRLHDTLITLAGPGMNFLLALPALALARAFGVAGWEPMAEVAVTLAAISLLLCFFNMLPVPPLDGSHLLKNVTGMSDMTYYRLSRFGLLAVIILIQVPFVWKAIHWASGHTLVAMADLVGLK